MAEDSRINRTQIWVTLITVLGGLLTALIVNVDKWAPRDEKPAAAATATPAAASPPHVAPSSAAPATDVASQGAAPATGATAARPAAAQAPTSVSVPGEGADAPSAPVSAAPAGPIDIAGEWRDDDGSRIHFTQAGNAYEYSHTAISGTLISAGKGTISGRDLTHTFEMLSGETGSCTARANEAINKITGHCLFEDGGWTFTIER
ncbi:hypothetical protein JI752_007035 [Lysobacter sp. MMG2]|uniref:hypothetical protein n=1 Tax=Lysobacter sp. MMG2 TaxID=2801338 RepID=UPI001C22880F|nr:hypothetical protein [Lysobacter sp. MMG2]MBU8975895.1 hypothetical protein [Lysobacter sp. MMG2]